MYKIVKSSEATVRQITDNKTANNLITKDISPNISLATTRADNYYEKETTEYDRIYFVLEGEMEVNIDGDTQTLTVGDACFISKGTAYEMRGSFNAVTVNQPAFGS
jgi:ethanolamine utilization protein EutQ (cupin superfamily)